MVEDAAQVDRAELISGRPAPDPLPHPLLEVEKILKEKRVEQTKIYACFSEIEQADQQKQLITKEIYRTESASLEKPAGTPEE